MPIAAPRLVLLDSVTQVTPAHAGSLVVTGSHGGASVVPYARAVRAWLYVFNDAGVGKDGAGIAALDICRGGGGARLGANRRGGGQLGARRRFASEHRCGGTRAAQR